MSDIGWERRLATASDRAALLSGRAWVMLAGASGFALAMPFLHGRPEQLAAGGIALGLCTVAGWLRLARLWSRRRARRRLADVMAFVEHDAAPAFCVDRQGAIVRRNRAAVERLGAGGPGEAEILSRVLAPLFANPDALVQRMRDAVGGRGAAREDVVTRRGHVRVSVHAIPEGQLWRLEDVIDRGGDGAAGVALPMLTAGPSGSILAMNEPLRQGIGRRVTRLADLFDDLPLRNGGVHRMRTARGAMPVRVVSSRPVADRKEVILLPADDDAGAEIDPATATALDALPVAILRVDDRGRVSSLNRLALRLLPRAAEGNMPLAALVEGLGRPVGDWLAEAMDGRGLLRPQMAHVTGAADAFVQITLGPSVEGDSKGLVAVLTDATEHKTMEAQLFQSQKMQAIGQLAGGVAHDFNNLLTAISGHCDLLLHRREEDDPDYADLAQINQNANRAAALVGQLLAFSRKQTLKMQPLDLRDTLGDMTHLLNRLVGERITLKVDHDPALIPIRGDPRQLEQVLMNLVVNARDAMPEGGEVSISTAVEYLEAGLARDRVTVPPGQYVVVRVRDAGRGIAPEVIAKIFEPFYTTKRPGEGTGLGLSMAYGIVKQSGGYIFADSEPGEGTTFTLWFPAGLEASRAPAGGMPEDVEPSMRATPRMLRAITAGESSASAAPPASRPAAVAAPVPARPSISPAPAAAAPAAERAKKTILLVEDEAPVRAFASRALRLKGFGVVEAENAEDALDQLADPALDVDLFVTDVMMPGMDGPTWVRKAMRDRPEVRTIFVSGYTQDSMSETSVPVPGSIFLAKPFSLSDLARTVERALQ